jgi:MinD-like ATPase involved in chromosome partitioning or flagellar assembly
MTTPTAAFVGATGGAGTTRLCLEAAALLASEGDDALVLDAAYATQGLAGHVEGRIDTDVTRLVTEQRPLAAGCYEIATAGSGTAECVPARAPFERVAHAKTPEAAQRLASLVASARERADAVLLDVPPVAANQSVAAVDAGDRIVVVAPGTRRGADGTARTRDRLTDIGIEVDAVVATRTEDTDFADVAVPTDDTPTGDTPIADAGNGAFTAGVASVVETVFDVTIERSFDDGLLPL